MPVIGGTMGIGGPILLIIFLLEALAGSTMSSPDAPSDPSLLCDEYEQLTLDGPDEPLGLDPAQMCQAHARGRIAPQPTAAPERCLRPTRKSCSRAGS